MWVSNFGPFSLGGFEGVGEGFKGSGGLAKGVLQGPQVQLKPVFPTPNRPQLPQLNPKPQA